MIKIYSSGSWVLVHHLKNTLEVAGIECTIKNDQIGKQLSENSPEGDWPELWVLNDGMLKDAKSLVHENIAAVDIVGRHWICEHCGANHELKFSFCWSCGADKDSE